MDSGRLVRALLLGALVFLVVGGGTGFAMAASQAPEPAAMAFPQPGASATYSVDEFHVGQARGSMDISFVKLTWMPETWVSDTDFHLRLTHPLRTELRVYGNDQMREAYYDAATGEPIISSGFGPFYYIDGGHGCDDGTDCEFRYDDYEGRGGPCAARNALQDGQSIHEPLRVTGFCDYLDGAEELTYRYVGKDEVQGRQAAFFQDADRPEFKAWFSPDLPFPVRFTSTLSDEIHTDFLGHERMYDLRLTDFTPGEGAYTRPEQSLVGDGPGPLPLVPRTPLMFDFAGFDAPLSFEDAYAKAASDTGADGLAGFLHDHPDAYVAEAGTIESVDGNGATHFAWSFIVTDGTAWKAASVRHGPRAISPLGIPVVAPPGTADGVWVDHWAMSQDDMDARNAGHYYVAPDLIPDQLFRPADALARQAFVENHEVPGSRAFAWSFTCKTDACVSVDATVWAGYDVTVTRGPVLPVFAAGEDGDQALLTLDAAGHPLRRSAFSYDRPAYSPLGGGDGSSPDYALAPNTVREEAVLWTMSDRAAASLSFLAVLASVLYYFWPAAKVGAFGLFSRIQPEDALEHPTRQKLLQLIEANPGIHFQELVRRMGSGRGTLEHHLRKLQDAELVSRVQAQSYTCYFARGQVDRRVMAAAPVLRADGARRLLAAIEQRPGASARQLAAQLGVANGTVTYHAKRLQDSGLVHSTGGGLNLTEAGRQAKPLAA